MEAGHRGAVQGIALLLLSCKGGLAVALCFLSVLTVVSVFGQRHFLYISPRTLLPGRWLDWVVACYNSLWFL